MLGNSLQGRYQVIQLLSAGGFCQTYLAKDTSQPKHPICVVKHLLPVSNESQSLETLVQLFIREAEALKKLDCYDRVPQLIDRFEENCEFYLVQEFIEGRPLSTELQRGFHWSESYIVQLLQEVLEILEVVHSHGLIHGDVKPSNLIRRRQDDRLVLIDFGSVQPAWTQAVTPQQMTNSAGANGVPIVTVVGTPGYMAAEQVRGFPRANSDIYALGAIAIQALTGLHPRQLREDSDTGEIIWQHYASVSPQLSCILNKMVRYHFKDRYSSATEVLKALETLAILYQPTQLLGFPQNKATIAETTIQNQAVLLSEQDTMSYVSGDRSVALLDKKTSAPTDPTPANKSILLMGVGIGVASVIALTASIYYFMRSPAPASRAEQDKILIPTKNNSKGNISQGLATSWHSDSVAFVLRNFLGKNLAHKQVKLLSISNTYLEC
ncbi:MAG TPA: serine/threonine protein kinase [Cyanobacteria bacterium UBA11049]|nr:serine/threonine protein kinase [Cyanobacteria bacterium UBA11049]